MAGKIYTFDFDGGTRGLSGKRYKWAAGQPVQAPAGEFDHLQKGSYQTRPLTPTPGPELPPDPDGDDGKSKKKTAPDRRISKAKGGWYVLKEDGREAGKVQGEAAARHWQDTGELPE